SGDNYRERIETLNRLVATRWAATDFPSGEMFDDASSFGTSRRDRVRPAAPYPGNARHSAQRTWSPPGGRPDRVAPRARPEPPLHLPQHGRPANGRDPRAGAAAQAADCRPPGQHRPWSV